MRRFWILAILTLPIIPPRSLSAPQPSATQAKPAAPAPTQSTSTSTPQNSAPAKPAAYLRRPDHWFQTPEARAIATNILSFQTPAGDWPKNTNTTLVPYPGDPAALRGTFDNSATLPELRFLARLVKTTRAPEFQKPFLKGLDHVLDAQYPNGGWPQTSPPSKNYDRHITFNDGTMLNLMHFVRDVATASDFDFLDAPRLARAATAFDRGLDCILKCQIRVQGQPTVWCAQHDEIDFLPQSARAYELPSYSGGESAGLVQLLMTIPKPSPEIITAIEGAVAWFQRAQLTGLRETKVADPNAPKGWDKRILHDPAAPPIWARFYDLKTMRPIYVDRDGIPKPTIAEIGYERRNGYAWHTAAPARILADHPAWKNKLVSPPQTNTSP